MPRLPECLASLFRLNRGRPLGLTVPPGLLVAIDEVIE
jgi:hypothetical protein